MTLVRRAKKGDREAFGELFERHRKSVFAVAWSGCARNADNAMDVVQEAFTKAFVSLPRFRQECSFLTWVRRIARNLCIDRKRAKSSSEVPFDEAAYGNPETGVVGKRGVGRSPRSEDPTIAARERELHGALDVAVQELSEKHKEVFLLHAVEELSYKEIAARVGCNIGTVMSRLHYARRHLRTMLKSYVQDEESES